MPPLLRPLLRPLPWWAVLSAVVAPAALIGGWLYAGASVSGYDPVRQPISDLAAGDAPGRWVMTVALVVTGIAHVVTAVGLRPADGVGRSILGVGGVATLIGAWIPNTHVGHNYVGHMIVTYMGFAALSLWPAVIARNVPGAPLVLRPTFGKSLAITLGVLVLITVADIVTGGATLGFRERLATSAQAVTPLLVVLGLVRIPVRSLPEPLLHP